MRLRLKFLFVLFLICPSNALVCSLPLPKAVDNALNLSLYSALLRRRFGAPKFRRDIEVLELVWRKAMELGEDLEPKSSEERLGKLSLEKKRLGVTLSLYNSLTGQCSQVGLGLFCRRQDTGT